MQERIIQTLARIAREDPTLMSLGVRSVTHAEASTPCPYLRFQAETMALNGHGEDSEAFVPTRKTHARIICEVVSHHPGLREIHAILERLRGLYEGKILDVIDTVAVSGASHPCALLQWTEPTQWTTTELGHKKVRLLGRLYMRG